MASGVQLACGVFAVAIPVLLAAGYYTQVLLDRLGDGRDLFVVAVTTVGGLIGEATALIGLLRPNRAWEAVGAVGTAVSAAGVVLVPLYALRLRRQRRTRSVGPAHRASAPSVQPHPVPRQHPSSYPDANRLPQHAAETRSAPPWGGADREDLGYDR